MRKTQECYAETGIEHFNACYCLSVKGGFTSPGAFKDGIVDPFDAYGNRWVTSPIGFPLYSFTPVSSTAYNTNNRLTTQFNSGMAYDAAGNQTGIGG
jgi:hypothetical protein